ncbi:hypothetical protein F5B20DRAFT_575666 [Whalleya microplaca]|nr:hypothetical protein F5B20DRAFT_575666 [Whalleya microplaca]
MAAKLTTIGKRSKRCLDLFHHNIDTSWDLKPSEANRMGNSLQDGLSRFKLWAFNIGVFADYQMSLDFRIRYLADVQELFSIQLDKIERRLCQLREGRTTSDVMADDGERNIDLTSEKDYFENWTLTRILQSIHESIDWLHRLSNLVRKASLVNQNKRAKDFLLPDSKGQESEAATEAYRENLKTYFEFLINRDLKGREDFMTNRLIETMITRHFQVLYRRSRHEKWDIPPVQYTANSAETLRKSSKPSSSKKTYPLQVSKSLAPPEQTMTPQHNRIATTVRQSTYQKAGQPLSTAICTPRNMEEQDLVPPRPMSKSETKDVTCPYCYLILPESVASNNETWAKHVKQDLNPYICVHEHCNRSCQIYSSSKEWLSHMTTQHRTEWQCLDINHEEPLVYDEPEKLEEHMKIDHAGTFSEDQLSSIIKISAQPATPLTYCPLCSLETVENLEEHVGHHLRVFAWRSLPWPDDPDVSSINDFPEDESQVNSQVSRDSLPPPIFDEVTVNHELSMPTPEDRLNLDRETGYIETHFEPLEGLTQLEDKNLKALAFAQYHVDNIESLRQLLSPPPNASNAASSTAQRDVDITYPSHSDDTGDVSLQVSSSNRRSYSYRAHPLYRLRLGLDDPERVRQISSRGEEFDPTNDYASQQRLQSKTYNSISFDASALVKTIELELDYAKVASALDSTKGYVPRNKLPRIITPERVRIIVSGPWFREFSDKDRLTEEICFGPSPRRKLLAVLIAMGCLEDLPEIMDDGMDDRCLPLHISGPPGYRLYCRYHGVHHRIINGVSRRPAYRQQFTSWSYSLVALYVKFNTKIHPHYLLDLGDVFPMQSSEKTKKHETSQMNYIPYGGYSEVYKIKIDRSHYDFGGRKISHPDGFFALKRLTSHNRDNFNMEISSLLFTMDNSSGKEAEKHVIQLLATFEVPAPAVQGSTYYLLFDWPEGSLADFWRRNQHLVGQKSHCRWMSQQFHKISSALQCVHNERLETLKSMDQSMLERELHGHKIDVQDLYGRHGDIKPDNFLWFQPNQSSSLNDLGVLALSDFGLGRLHTQVSRSKQDPKSLTWTATYRAPEFDLSDGMISRASDIFSLGCVFLEYVTWFLEGRESVLDTFPEKRFAQDIHDFRADTFFTITPDTGSKKQLPSLKPSVTAWINKLQRHKDCSWYLHQLLEIIRDDMLEPDRVKRIHILQLIRKMATLRDACEMDESFYLTAKGDP